MYSWALIAIAGVVAASCSSGVETPGLDSDTDGLQPIACDPDNFNSLEQTRPATVGTPATDTICPRADRDYWKLTGVGGAKQLLNVDIVYDKLGDVELQADVWGPRGRCMPTALTQCTDVTQCAPTFDYCDLDRGGCRASTAGVCFDNNDCNSGEQCYGATTAIELIGEVRIPPSAALQHRLTANFAAFSQGDYTVIVSDHAEREEEAVKTYALTVSTQTDPDVNEPNDLTNQATPLTAAQNTEGAMSYVNDIDWYVITPVAGSPAVVKVELSYPSTSAIAPSWTVIQGGFEYVGPEIVIEGSGGTARRRQAAAVVTPTDQPIYIRVQNLASATNSTDRYTLNVDLTTDPIEGNARNDDLASATNVPGGSPTAGGLEIYNQTNRTLVAVNDFDWYRIERTSMADNSLIYISATADEAAPYALLLQAYRPTTTTCDALNQCAQGRPCSQEGVCLDLMIQRPGPDGPGDPQLGGLSPNRIETQLPLLADIMYLRVVHNQANLLGKIGYDFTKTQPYALRILHKVEPDAGDLTNSATAPDNRFLSRPFDVDESDFAPKYRNVTGGGVTVTPSVPGDTIAVVHGGPGAPTLNGTNCTTVTIDIFNGLGEPNNVAVTGTITASGGTVLAACGGAAAAIATSGSSMTVGVTAAVAGDPVTLTATVAGSAAVTSFIPGTPALNFLSTLNTAPERAVAAGTATETLRIRSPNTSGMTLNLSVPTGGIMCAVADSNGRCPGDDLAAGYCSPTAAAASCRMIIPAGGQNADIRASFPTAGSPQMMTVRNAANDVIGTYTWTVYTPGSAIANDYNITGYISYDGDQDFFEVRPTTLGDGGMTLYVQFNASQLDLRVNAYRNNEGVGFAYENDICEDGCSPGSCNNARGTCQQPLLDLERGPNASEPECVFVHGEGTDPIRVWVNDVQANDWDEDNQYAIKIEYVEGCPAACPPASCN